MKIPFTLSEKAFVKISLVDETGQTVQRFDLGKCKAGANEISWEGRNIRGFTYAYGKYYPVMELTDLSGNKATVQAPDQIIMITDKYGLTASNANLRKGAGLENEIIRMIPKGSEIKIIGESGDWYQVEYRMLSNMDTGYIYKPLITVRTNAQISQDLPAIALRNVNVRTSTGTQYDVKTVILMNTGLKVVGSFGDWYLVGFQKNGIYSDQGYVAKYLVAVSPDTGTVHIVQAGDTLWKIAQKYGTTVDAIIKLNNLDPDKYLYIGQKLTISG